MNSVMRTSATCSRGDCRAYWRPVRIAPTKRSPGNAPSLRSARQRKMTTKAAIDSVALNANTAALPSDASSAPAKAGPTMRGRFIATPLSASAAPSCARGTRLGTMAENTGQRIAIVMPFRNVSSSSSGAVRCPSSDTPTSTTAISAAHSCVAAK